MSGHSRWSTIKRKKGAKDAKRGQLFSRLIKEITIAAKLGGGDADTNTRLRIAIATAKENNMPKDNIKRAIRRGTGAEEGVNYEDVLYEAYGSGGVAFLLETLTDNRNRTVGEVRYILDKNGGSLAESGSVAWQFEKIGLIVIDDPKADPDRILDIALETGAEDINQEEDIIEIFTPVSKFHDVCTALDDADIARSLSEISMRPKSTVRVEGKEAEKLLHLYELLEEHDDIQKVWANFDIPDEILSAVAEG